MKVRYKAHHDTTECEEYRHGRQIKLSSSPPMMRIDHTHEPTLVKGGDKMTTRKTLTSGDIDLGVIEDDSGYGCKTRALKEQIQIEQGGIIIRPSTMKSDITPSTTNPTDLVLVIKIEDTQDTQDCDRHNKSSGDIPKCRKRGVQPPLGDLDDEIHPNTLPTPGGVHDKGEEMEVVN